MVRLSPLRTLEFSFTLFSGAECIQVSRENEASYQFDFLSWTLFGECYERDSKPIALKPEVFETLLARGQVSGVG
jgi:hypothetical protein